MSKEGRMKTYYDAGAGPLSFYDEYVYFENYDVMVSIFNIIMSRVEQNVLMPSKPLAMLSVINFPL